VDTLLESQLFGHVRGSFTGATDTRQDYLNTRMAERYFWMSWRNFAADAGEAAASDPEPRDQRVGSPEVRQINVRMIAATNRDLRAEVLAGRFREICIPVKFHFRSVFHRWRSGWKTFPVLVQFF